ncbi:MAG: hypothetical protein K8F91_27330, partial [Candidatus Obscuribacterales bacterium]|nr:hypothetical protein [Candidatus Obscuribacterales bacterium]
MTKFTRARDIAAGTNVIDTIKVMDPDISIGRDLFITPQGRLMLSDTDSAESGQASPFERQIAYSITSNQASGLFALAATKPDSHLTPSLSYWREFASLYLTKLCRTPDSSGAILERIEPPAPQELELVLAQAPPMRGAEYLSLELLTALWEELDDWVKAQVTAFGGDLADWLRKHAPQWQQVGRVCFHLAENKRDREFPFAFLATYAPRVSEKGQVQYQPLSSALKEYAGERNKKALIGLLSPVNLASKKSSLINELVESNDIFHPLKWTPGEAYRFLCEVPLLEESGLLVRLPDWWHKRPRPRVSVTIGQNKQSLLGLDAMLDFNVELVLGDSKLSRKELEQLMNDQEGLLLIKGRWVEVDKQKLSEALDHWSQVEKESFADGISFLEGMRLLAGAPADLDTNTQLQSSDRNWFSINAGSWLSEILANLKDPSRLAPSNSSKNFVGTLRPYQKIGHDWLRLLSSLGLGACLADDMGLGKTVQILSLLLSIKED